MRKTSKQFDRSKGVLVIVIALLTFVILILVATYPKKQISTTTTASNTAGVHVSLGAVQYDFVNGKAVKIKDEKLTKLGIFLADQAKKDLGSHCPSAYYSAIVANQDKTQVLLKYGCSYPSADMYVVYRDDQWRLLSPTNSFGQLPIPLCNHVNDNHIATSIAPVCMNEPQDGGTAPTYSIRE